MSLDLFRDLARAEALADLARPLALAAFAQSLTVDRKADHSRSPRPTALLRLPCATLWPVPVPRMAF